MDMFAISVILCIALTVLGANTADIGDSCQLPRSSRQGVCQVINNCSPVIDEIVDHGLFPAQCGFRGRDQIVCCPLPSTWKATTTTPQPTRISQIKCKQYEDAKYETYWSDGLNNKPVMQSVNRCTMSTIGFAFDGGLANPNEFPHMVVIGFERTSQTGITWACGGSLISEEFILTAAHCVETSHDEGTPKYILLGKHDLTNDKYDRPLQVEISQKFPHPQFNRSTKYYDIALLKMAQNVTFSPYIRPACLPDRYQYPNEHAVASGWGHTDCRGQRSQVLKKVTLELFTERECNATYADEAWTNFGIIPAQQFCAGLHTEKIDACQVDLEGPLQIADIQRCIYRVLGITSFVKQCDDSNVLGVYTRVYDFLDWIESVVWPQQ